MEYNKYRYVENNSYPSTYIEFNTLEEALEHKRNNGNVGIVYQMTRTVVG